MGVLNDAFNKNQTGQLLNKAARQGQQLLPLLRHPLGMAFVENRKPQDPSRLPIIIFHHLPQKKMTITWRIPQKSHRVDHQFPFLKNSHFGTIPPFQTRPKDKTTPACFSLCCAGRSNRRSNCRNKPAEDVSLHRKP